MQENLICEPVELIDEDLDVVAGGIRGIHVDVNLADVDQFIKQVQVFGVFNSQAAANVSSVSQSS
jgi:hypothetical protein